MIPFPLTFDESFHNLGQKVFSLLAFTLNVPNKLNSEEIDMIWFNVNMKKSMKKMKGGV